MGKSFRRTINVGLILDDLSIMRQSKAMACLSGSHIRIYIRTYIHTCPLLSVVAQPRELPGTWLCQVRYIQYRSDPWIRGNSMRASVHNTYAWAIATALEHPLPPCESWDAVPGIIVMPKRGLVDVFRAERINKCKPQPLVSKKKKKIVVRD